MWHSHWVLGLFASFAWRAAAWNHISEHQLQEALDASGYTLIACKSTSASYFGESKTNKTTTVVMVYSLP